ncbi:hypothetical protein [Bosea sp. (in: a-proteobacteria)]|uniref:hypothetical protein n=1 Tax=Bosea sp. (in: a-proteobacteria) TaxID=1871050 RepID=UPI001AC24D84|nr:hypothetical protein [Bosea sp. (in: a-proteobacteria)]MBN9437039.1 hypothetical protein [Bosea sp. (in: a-proteobacteria)]
MILIALSPTQIGAQTLKTQIVSLEFFAGLYQDMLGIDILRTRRNTIMGVHPTLGQLSFMECDPLTGDGVLIHLDPAALYIRRKGELTPAERDAAEIPALTSSHLSLHVASHQE